MRFGDAEIGEHQSGGFGLHRGAAIGMEGELAERDIMLDDGVVEQWFEPRGAFSIGDAPGDDPAAEGAPQLSAARMRTAASNCLRKAWRPRRCGGGTLLSASRRASVRTGIASAAAGPIAPSASAAHARTSLVKSVKSKSVLKASDPSKIFLPD
jgi:hypothetical protein